MKHNLFSKEELNRYSRHLLIPEIGLKGQTKLKEAKVLCVGAGGLGSPLLLYLAAAGVGTIGIVDFDRVDDSNLQRQVLFNTNQIGELKTESAKQRLMALNPHINIICYSEKLNSSNALGIIKNYDLVADGTDNFPSRYLVNDACVILGKPNVYASIFRFEGQVSVFNFKNQDGSFGPNYRDLFPSPPAPGTMPSCEEAGVLGVLPGIIGSIQASEVIKVITEIGKPLAGRLFVFDALDFESRVLKISKNPDLKPIKELIDYEEFCGLKLASKENKIKEISVQELKRMQDADEVFSLIDVREIHEFEQANLGAKLISLSKVETEHLSFKSPNPVIVHCRSGARSAKAIQLLEKQFGYQNLFNLKGGIIAYAQEIDSSLVV